MAIFGGSIPQRNHLLKKEEIEMLSCCSESMDITVKLRLFIHITPSYKNIDPLNLNSFLFNFWQQPPVASNDIVGTCSFL